VKKIKDQTRNEFLIINYCTVSPQFPLNGQDGTGHGQYMGRGDGVDGCRGFGLFVGRRVMLTMMMIVVIGKFSRLLDAPPSRALRTKKQRPSLLVSLLLVFLESEACNSDWKVCASLLALSRSCMATLYFPFLRERIQLAEFVESAKSLDGFR
jgi:hypothetical protein